MQEMVKRIIRDILGKWDQYKYRFVPWIALNLKNKSVRSVPTIKQDRIVSASKVISQLHRYFTLLDTKYNSSQPSTDKRSSIEEEHSNCPRSQQLEDRIDHFQLEINKQNFAKNNAIDFYQFGLQAMIDLFDFQIERRKSVIAGGGTGVFVKKGQIKQGSVVALYPGCVYRQFEPIFFQSIKNPFIFRCIDGVLIDGNDKGISKFVFRSCCERDRIGPFFVGDMSWLTPYPLNPMAVGQYVNNHNKEYPANVAYQEVEVPVSFPFHLRRFIPNIYYSARNEHIEPNERLMRIVALVSTKDIAEGEEIFSSYFTVVHE